MCGAGGPAALTLTAVQRGAAAAVPAGGSQSTSPHLTPPPAAAQLVHSTSRFGELFCPGWADADSMRHCVGWRYFDSEAMPGLSTLSRAMGAATAAVDGICRCWWVQYMAATKSLHILSVPVEASCAGCVLLLLLLALTVPRGVCHRA